MRELESPKVENAFSPFFSFYDGYESHDAYFVNHYQKQFIIINEY